MLLCVRFMFPVASSISNLYKYAKHNVANLADTLVGLRGKPWRQAAIPGKAKPPSPGFGDGCRALMGT